MIQRVLPAFLKSMILSSRSYNRLHAKKLSSSSKRIDICAAQLAHSLHLSQCSPLSGKVCLEIGSGWVLSHAIVFHLLGAKRVIAADVLPIAEPQFLFTAIHDSIISVIRDILSPFEDHALLRKRLDKLLSVRRFNFGVLRELGIGYVAPIDFVERRLNFPVDFVFSNSVLEHVPCADVPLFLANMVADLNPGGAMIHCIHLEDHKYISNAPFGFLSLPESEYSLRQQASRGNRIRKSTWQKLFDRLEGVDSALIYEWARTDKEPPEQIDKSISYKDDVDLRVSHIGIYSKKKQMRESLTRNSGA